MFIKLTLLNDEPVYVNSFDVQFARLANPSEGYNPRARTALTMNSGTLTVLEPLETVMEMIDANTRPHKGTAPR